MKKSAKTTTIAGYIKMLNGGEIDFDYPIQRNGGQWNEESASLLMHSIMADYPVPPVYALVNKIAVTAADEDGDGDEVFQDVYSILDGKQRLSYLQRFINDGFVLHESTPPVAISVSRGKVENVEVAGEYFSTLDQRVKEAFLNAELDMVQINSATEEEIENIFFRLNNGQALTKTQQGKALMGSTWAKLLVEASEHPTITTNAQFTPLQKKKADDETIVIQTMMIMDSLNGTHNLTSIASNHVFEYMKKMKEEEERLLPFYNKVIEGLDYLHEAYENFQEKLALKKVHITATILTALHAKEKGIAPVRFRDWTGAFEQSYREKGSYIETDYKNHSQQGTVTGTKALGRVSAMIAHFDTYIEQSKKDNVELQTAIQQLKEVVGETEGAENVDGDKAKLDAAKKAKADAEKLAKAEAKKKADEEKKSKAEAAKLAKAEAEAKKKADAEAVSIETVEESDEEDEVQVTIDSILD